MKVLILDDWEYFFQNHPALEKLKPHFEVATYHDKPTKEELIKRLKDADVVIPLRERTTFTKDILQEMKHVKLLSQTGAGVAHIDVEEASRLNIPIATTPGGSRAVMELIFGFILAYSRKLTTLDQELKKGNWQESVGIGLENKTIGIIGLGKIGVGLAQLAKAFQMRVLAWGPRLTKERAEENGVEYATLETLLKESNYISINVRLVAETYHLIQKQHFDLMRKDAFFINTSRGEVVDEEAMIEALKQGIIGGAGLDVFTVEPLESDHPLLTLDNVILSPHIGWKTDNMFNLFLETAVENVLSYFIERKPQRIINESTVKGIHF
jgi:D-3-phosphoglycerate dehydrogenase / 2-oxoglutarate reductase